ncbi:hypothetical protein Clacol_007479 [Clathrus columnatus]|uniref:Cation/H+ exchanger transmembrane domain-containing protein n=1 Tax=Clathrus columnatus TaxID=1419009 RepID=A0AAV5AKK5_9AGAM|nr:hypothetical protein Clacol_007479 [Clathrus columnatus]
MSDSNVGGNSIAASKLFSSFLLSLAVALTGIILPIAFSFILLNFGTTPLQCFVSGASLSSTSLGTTFTILSNNGLVNSRMGTVLTTAAMFDDIIGLIMLQIVVDIDKTDDSPNWAEIICRPIGVSIGLILASLGFAIPISPMVKGDVIWKGIVYSILMFISKFATAIWPWLTPKLHKVWTRYKRSANVSGNVQKSVTKETRTDQTKLSESGDLIHDIHMQTDSPLLSFAMVARGEIGFLISSLAASQGQFGDEDEFYLIALWAIVICTILGPLCVGLFVRRMKQLN